jgi:glycosyltransferase involved in cell wall biosynthesis
VRIAVSRKLADDMERLGAGETVVVPNLVDERFFAPGPGPRATEPTFLFLGRLEAEKGLPELLKAMALLGHGFRLRVGGYGKPFETPPDAAVTWLGALDREQVLEELRGATAVVLPSRQESFGVVLAEAIACGTPIVATACGGPEDIVTEDNGLLVPVGDPSALAAALRKVTERRYDAERIRADFLARFSRSVVVDQLDSHYRRAIAARLAGHAPSGRA